LPGVLNPAWCGGSETAFPRAPAVRLKEPFGRHQQPPTAPPPFVHHQVSRLVGDAPNALEAGRGAQQERRVRPWDALPRVQMGVQGEVEVPALGRQDRERLVQAGGPELQAARSYCVIVQFCHLSWCD
jgi:hypothetical protein